jgi:type VI secretion system protein ImpJ
MDFSNPIFWRQGIFLQPQHFQYEDRFLSTTYEKLFSLSRTQAYGVVSFELSKDRLNAGYLSSGDLEAVMPGGTWVDITKNARLPDRDIRQLLATNGVHHLALGLPKLIPGVPSVANEQRDGRYEVTDYPENLPDLYEDTPPVEIERLWLRCRYLIGDEIESSSNFTILPLGKLIVESQTITLDSEYSPPCMRIGAYQGLQNLTQKISDSLEIAFSRLSKLAHPWRLDGRPIDPAWLRDRMVQTDLSQTLAEMHHRIRLNVEPAILFESLLVLAMRLCSTGGLTVPVLPLWEHDDPHKSFRRIGEIVLALLEQLRSGPDSMAVFEQQQGWMEAQIPHSARVGKHYAYLIVEQVTEEALLQAGPPKLSSTSKIETIVSRALPGIPLERLQHIPYGLGEGFGSFVWSIVTQDPMWQEAYASGTLCLNWLDLPRNAQVTVVFFRA